MYGNIEIYKSLYNNKLNIKIINITYSIILLLWSIIFLQKMNYEL